jgi:hypothetical protein
LCAFAIYANPRSTLALAALLAGVLAAAMAGGERPHLKQLAVRLVAVVVVAALLMAPELVALARFEHLYYFVHYERYGDLRAYWDSSVQAVGGLFFWLGFAGFILAWLPGSGRATRSVAATLACYVLGTAMLVQGAGPASIVEQLEATRLMPFQRLLWLWLAASAVGTAAEFALRLTRARSRVVEDVFLVGATAAVAWLYVVRPPGFIPAHDRGLVSATSSAQAGIVDLRDAVRLADERAAPGTALLVLGILRLQNAWHDQMWAPLWSDRPFFFDDWLWYWQTEHVGQYDPLRTHAYDSDTSALEREYLGRHGVGAVIVTGEAQQAARSNPNLQLVREGIWDLYLVVRPTTVVTFAGANAESVAIGHHEVRASGNGGEIVVRRNWFPRWQAYVEGEPAAIRHRDDGYITVDAPAGEDAELTLQYELDQLDWIGRIAAAAGLAAAAGMLLPPGWMPTPRARSARR